MTARHTAPSPSWIELPKGRTGLARGATAQPDGRPERAGPPGRTLLALGAAAMLGAWLGLAAAIVVGGFDSAGPEPEIHYAPAENLEWIDVAGIDQARRRLDVAADVLTDVAVIAALTDAARRGVKVRLILSVAGAAGAGHNGHIAGVEERITPAGVLMNLKSWCADGATLRTGAANFAAMWKREG